MIEMAAAVDGDAAAAAGRVLLGYAVVLATPGPNMLAILAVAAARGFAAAVPLCLGVACGVGALAAACLAAASALPDLGPWGDDVARVAQALLLLYLALRVLRGAAGAGAARLAGFGAGVCTAVANPVTAAFFVSQFAGPPGVAPGRTAGVVAVLGAAAMALGCGLILAGVPARRLAWRAAPAWHRAVCIGGAAALVVLAFLALRPVVA
jgi:threonine/homoserine/homoserine lactone efflux protein